MSAAEKAKDLIDEMYLIDPVLITLDTATELAKTCVDNIIQALSEYDERTEKYLKEEKGIDFTSYETQNMDSSFRYWEQVLKEIQKQING